jgi:hypothetical protein
MKPNRQVSGPSIMEHKAAELSALFAEAGWTQSVANFEPRPFVLWHGAWFSAAGAPPGHSSNAISCRTPEEVIAWLESFKAPEPREEPEVVIEAAPQPDPRDEELEAMRAKLVEMADQLAAKPKEIVVERIVEMPAPSVPQAPLPLPPSPEFAKLSDYGDVGDEVSIITKDEVNDLLGMDEAAAAEAVKAMKGERRKRFTELLHAEHSELRNHRGMAGEDLKREAAIEGLLGLFARLGEV